MLDGIPVAAWESIDERGNHALHRDHTSANNYVSKPSMHGMLEPLYRGSDVERLLAELRRELE